MDNISEQIDAKLNILKDFVEVAEAAFKQETHRYYAEGTYQYDTDKHVGMSIKERHRMALRAVYFELSAFVENQMQSWIEDKWLEIDEGIAKLPLEGGRMIEISKLKKYEFVSKLDYGQVVRFIKKHFNIELKDIDRHKEVLQIRAITNSLKHYRGLRDIRKIDNYWEEITSFKFWPYHIVEAEAALKAIEDTRVFLHSLWNEMLRVQK